MTRLPPDAGFGLNSVHPIDERVTLEDRAYHELRRATMEGILPPGSRISVNAMAKQLGVSRLPVIHALRRLASEGFVQIHPHKNVTVTKPTAKDVRGRYLMMTALEEVAIREAWPLDRAILAQIAIVHQRFCQELLEGGTGDTHDRDFHATVWREAGIEHLTSTLETLWDLGGYYRMKMGQQFRTQVPERIAEHEGILKALQIGDLEAAAALIRTHRLNGLARVQGWLES